MGPLTELPGNVWVVLALIGLALVLTFYIFRRRLFERGDRKGEAKNPTEVRRENPPDQWSRSR